MYILFFKIVVAAGNNGFKGSTSLYSPATAKNVLSVGASQLSRNAYLKTGVYMRVSMYLYLYVFMYFLCM